jgi:hypothetical protein
VGGNGAWVFNRSGTVWSQQQMLEQLVGTCGAAPGYSVALSADGNTAIAGDPGANSQLGAAWIFVDTVSVAPPTATHDFNGDCKSDIAWRDTSGTVAIWFMNGTSVLNPNAAGVGNVPIIWTIQDALGG